MVCFFHIGDTGAIFCAISVASVSPPHVLDMSIIVYNVNSMRSEQIKVILNSLAVCLVSLVSLRKAL